MGWIFSAQAAISALEAALVAERRKVVAMLWGDEVDVELDDGHPAYRAIMRERRDALERAVDRLREPGGWTIHVGSGNLVKDIDGPWLLNSTAADRVLELVREEEARG
ncbi:MAG: hypothetical protein AAF682_19525 [Planctomycetota bacterium]